MKIFGLLVFLFSLSAFSSSCDFLFEINSKVSYQGKNYPFHFVFRAISKDEIKVEIDFDGSKDVRFFSHGESPLELLGIEKYPFLKLGGGGKSPYYGLSYFSDKPVNIFNNWGFSWKPFQVIEKSDGCFVAKEYSRNKVFSELDPIIKQRNLRGNSVPYFKDFIVK